MKRASTPSTVTSQAANWHALNRSGPLSAADRHAFMDWLVAAPEHLREYLELGVLCNDLGEALACEDVDALLTSSDSANNEKVVALPVHTSDAIRNRARSEQRRRLRPAWAAAAFAGVVATILAAWFSASDSQLYEVQNGPPQRKILADGSTLWLDAGSRVTVHVSPLQRNVDVQRGRAAFVVAGERRPFHVHAAGLRIRDIGTTFSVALQREQARIDVLEGRVQVTADTDSRPIAILDAGQSARVAYQDNHADLSQEQPAAISGWWHGRIVFRDEELRDVVDQFNRRNRKQVVLEDTQASAVRITGNLRADSVDALSAYLRTQPMLDVREETDQIHVRSRPQ